MILACRWRHDGKAIPAQTNPILTLSKVQASDAGNYSVTVTIKTPLGVLATRSSEAALDLLPPP